MKKQEKNVILYVIIFLSILGLTLGGYYLLINKETEDISTEGEAPSKDDQEKIEEFYNNCPLVELIMVTNAGQVETNNFKITDLNCNEKTFIEDITVEIYTQNLEEGKKEFINWLAENDLEENEKLRIEYIHNPK